VIYDCTTEEGHKTHHKSSNKRGKQCQAAVACSNPCARLLEYSRDEADPLWQNVARTCGCCAPSIGSKRQEGQESRSSSSAPVATKLFRVPTSRARRMSAVVARSASPWRPVVLPIPRVSKHRSIAGGRSSHQADHTVHMSPQAVVCAASCAQLSKVYHAEQARKRT
jgi:hypothetical protein